MAIVPDVLSVTVAGWGPAFGYPVMPIFGGPAFEDHEPAMPYEHRSKASVEVAESATLGDVIDLAAARFGVTPASGPGITTVSKVSEAVDCVSFYRPSDRVGGTYDYRRWSQAIRLVNQSGDPSWAVRWSDIRMGELVASADAGLVDGDPLRPYLWPVIPQGDTVERLATAAWTIWMLWEHALSVRDTVQLARDALSRIARGQAVARDDPAAWATALRRPDELMSFLHAQPRTAVEVAAKMGFTEEQAEGAMWGLGFTAREDGRWVPAGDRIAAALHEAMMQIESLGRAPTELEVQVTVRALFRDGER